MNFGKLYGDKSDLWRHQRYFCPCDLAVKMLLSLQPEQPIRVTSLTSSH